MAGDFDEMRRLVQQDEALGFILSLRKIVPTFSGNAIQVRRSSDNVVQDIGFSSGVLDETALLAFVGGGKKLSAAAGVPLMDKHASVYLAVQLNSIDNGIIYEEYSNANTSPPYKRNVLTCGTNSNKQFFNHKPVTADNYGYFLVQQAFSDKIVMCFQNDFASVYAYRNNVFQDGFAITERFPSTTTDSIGFQTNGSNHFNGKMFEIQAFSVYHNSTERGAIHTDINSFYTFY